LYARYFARRLLLTLPVLFGISIIAFLVIYLAPENFVDNFRLLGFSIEELEAIEHRFGLDQPFII
jgi:peptide/nickel transport system permease protein